jgi:hypothetical protein
MFLASPPYLKELAPLSLAFIRPLAINLALLAPEAYKSKFCAINRSRHLIEDAPEISTSTFFTVPSSFISDAPEESTVRVLLKAIIPLMLLAPESSSSKSLSL